MLVRLLAPLVAIGLALGIGPGAEARSRDKMVLLGTAKLDKDATTATIDVSQAKGAFKAIRIESSEGPIDVTGVRVVYNDDSFFLVEKSFTLNRGERTKPLDERDAGRFVDTVFINYKAGEKPAEVQIYGIQDRDGARKARAKPATTAAINTPKSDAAAPAAAVKPAIYADPASIAEGRDVMFGYQNVAFTIDKDRIQVGADTGKFHAIRLRVLENDLFITAVDVTYTDGSSQTLPLEAQVKAGQKTKWLKVEPDKFIKELQISYRTRPNSRGQARVEVLGQYAEGWLGSGGEGRKYNEGWVLLGSQTAGAIGFDKDVISVGKNEGGFKRVRLKVRDRSITLREIKVVYLDGSDDVIRTNERVDPDQVVGPWDLKAGATAIKEIVAVYRRRVLFGKGQGAAVVEFWGQH